LDGKQHGRKGLGCLGGEVAQKPETSLAALERGFPAG